MRRFVPLALAAALIAATACSTPMTAPEMTADPSLTFDAARARWLAIRPPDYSFEFDAESANAPSPGYYRAAVVGGQLVAVQRSYSGELAPIEQGFTIDQLWQRLAAARAAGLPVADLQFSQEGIPMQASVGTPGTDGAVRYQLRWYMVGRVTY